MISHRRCQGGCSFHIPHMEAGCAGGGKWLCDLSLVKRNGLELVGLTNNMGLLFTSCLERGGGDREEGGLLI